MNFDRRSLVASLALLVSATVGAQQAPLERFFTIETKHPGMADLIEPGAQLELLGDRYGLTEGPVWIDDADGGYLIFGDLIADSIFKWAPKQGTTLFLDKAGYTGNDIYSAGTQTIRGRMHVLLIGPNGVTLDPQGRVVWCAAPDRKIMRLEKDGTRTVIAEKYQGKRFNGVNDLMYRADGTLYFSDTIWGMRSARPGKFAGGEPRELATSNIYMVKNGEVTIAADEKMLGGMPNGLAFSPDEKYLYANGGDAAIMRFEVQADGKLTNGTVFIKGEGSDGIKTDDHGNVYTTSGAGPGEIRITSPQGVRLGSLKLPQYNREPRPQICATNVAFGDRDRKGLYITACEAVYRVPMKVSGAR